MDVRDAEDAVKKMDGFKGWVSDVFFPACNATIHLEYSGCAVDDLSSGLKVQDSETHYLIVSAGVLAYM